MIVYQMVVAGVGGQGSVMISHVIANAAIKEGFNVRVGEKFGAAMRGGAVSSHIRMFKGEDVAPVIPPGEADSVMALEPLEGARAASKFLKRGGVLLMNIVPIYPVDVSSGRAKYPDVDEIVRRASSFADVYALDAVELARKAGSIKTVNSVMLGSLSGLMILPISRENLLSSLLEGVPRGTEEVNRKAFELGERAMKGKK
ncbi:MAG: indolepyruvate oxidoreductase subunit beta [Candidatus Methanodesulfokora sp.]|jgi:indolepyruvate ferredoxin oxidoreductase beta subunit